MTTPLGKNTAWADKLLLTITWTIDCSQSFLRSSRWSALRYGRPAWVSVKYTLGEWDRHPFKPRRPPPWYIWNQDGCRTGRRSSTWVSENRDGFDPPFSTFFFTNRHLTVVDERNRCVIVSFMAVLLVCFNEEVAARSWDQTNVTRTAVIASLVNEVLLLKTSSRILSWTRSICQSRRILLELHSKGSFQLQKEESTSL